MTSKGSLKEFAVAWFLEPGLGAIIGCCRVPPRVWRRLLHLWMMLGDRQNGLHALSHPLSPLLLVFAYFGDLE